MPRPIIKNTALMSAVELLPIKELWKNTMRKKQLRMVRYEFVHHASLNLVGIISQICVQVVKGQRKLNLEI